MSQTGTFKTIAYHGTVEERPLMAGLEHLLFDDADPNHNDLKAFFVTNGMSCAKLFSERNFYDAENQLKTTLEVQIDAQRAFIVEGSSSEVVEYDGSTYNMDSVSARAELHDRLREDGFDALVLKDHYVIDGQGMDDIAVLDASALEIRGLHMGNDDDQVFCRTREDAVKMMHVLFDEAPEDDYESGYSQGW